MSISLNGSTSNYLSIASTLGLSGAGAQTIAGWFKPANTNANKMAFATLFADGFSSTFGARFNSSGNIDGYGNAQTGTIKAYSASTWYYVYCRRDTGAFTFFMGAAASGLSATSDFGDTDGGTLAYTGGSSYSTFEVGRKWADGFPWNGEFCCLRAWDTQLSTTELLAEARSATPVKTANLRANWRFADNSDVTSTVNSYTLTKNGTVSTGSTEPTDIAAAAAGVPKTTKLLMMGIG